MDLFPPSPIQETTTLILAFPCPPNSNTLPLRQGRIVSIDTSEDEASSIFNGTDPFRASASSTKVETPPSTIVGEEISRDPNTILPSPPLSRVATPTSIAPSAAISSTTVSTFRKSIQRLRSIKKGNFFSFHHLAQKVSPNPHTDNEAPSRFLLLPELSFDPAPLSVSLHDDNLPIESSPPADKGAPATPHLHDTRSDPIPQFPLVRYECVDPRELQASPAVTASVEFSPSATPLPPPSPSWLSRNIHDLEPTASRTLPVPQIPPPSPAPLPILPRYLDIQ